MKKNILIMLFFCMLFLSLYAKANFELSDVYLGSNTQVRGLNTSTTIAIKNIADQKIENIYVLFNGNSVYNLVYNLSKTSIEPNETIYLTVHGYVPLDFDAVDSNGNKKSFKISDLNINAKYQNGTDVSTTKFVFMEAENKLRFTTGSKILIEEVEKSLRNEKEYDIRRNDNIELKIEIENKFSTSGDCESESKDCDLDDIELNVESDDSDLDVEEDASYSTLRAGKKSSKTIKFSIPDDLDEDNYLIYMWVTGEDENGALHGDRWEFTLNLELPDDEVSITEAYLYPEEISCDTKNVKLYVTIKNTGRDDQDDASIWVDSTKLNIMDSNYNIQIDEEEKRSYTFDLRMPNNLKEGTYSILVRANVNEDDETDRETLTLKVTNCNVNNIPTVPTNPPTQNIPDVKPDTGNTGTNIENNVEPPTSGIIYGTEKNTFFESKEFIYVLIGLIVLILIILFLVLGMLIKR